jgi:hypothetical protein
MSKLAIPQEGTQLFPLCDLSQPLGQGYTGSNCHDNSGSVSFVKTSPIARVMPGSSKDCLKISNEDIRICPHPVRLDQHVQYRDLSLENLPALINVSIEVP